MTCPFMYLDELGCVGEYGLGLGATQGQKKTPPTAQNKFLKYA